MHNAQFKNIIILFINIYSIVILDYLVILEISFYLRRVLELLEPPERLPPLLLPPLNPPDERVDDDEGRYVDELRVDDDELLTLVDEELRLVVVDDELLMLDDDIEREGADIALLVSLVVVGRAGNAEVEVLRR